MTDSDAIPTTQLPAVVREYLAAHAARDAETALRSFSPDAVVVDDGHTFHGAAEVLRFLRQAGATFDYTTELTGARRIDDDHWVALNRLEGDFPGGVVDLRFEFTLGDGLIDALTIGP